MSLAQVFQSIVSPASAFALPWAGAPLPARSSAVGNRAYLAPPPPPPALGLEPSAPLGLPSINEV